MLVSPCPQEVKQYLTQSCHSAIPFLHESRSMGGPGTFAGPRGPMTSCGPRSYGGSSQAWGRCHCHGGGAWGCLLRTQGFHVFIFQSHYLTFLQPLWTLGGQPSPGPALDLSVQSTKSETLPGPRDRSFLRGEPELWEGGISGRRLLRTETQSRTALSIPQCLTSSQKMGLVS